MSSKPTYPKPTRLSLQEANLLSQKPSLKNFPAARSHSPNSNIPPQHVQSGTHLCPRHLQPPSPPLAPSHSPRLSHSSNFTTTSSNLTTSSTLHPSRLIKRTPSKPNTKTRKEQKALLYNIHTHSFRTAYPSVLLNPNSSKARNGEGRKRSTSNAHTLLSPTIRTAGSEDNSYHPSNDGDTDEDITKPKGRIFPISLKSAPKTLANLLHHHDQNPPKQKYSPIPPLSPRSFTTPIPTLSYAFTNPPLLSQNQYMIVPLPRWTRSLEFNWRTRTYGLSEEEMRQGVSVVYTRRQKLPVWVWVGRNFGIEVGELGVGGKSERGDEEGMGLVGGKWREVWVERGV